MASAWRRLSAAGGETREFGPAVSGLRPSHGGSVR